jgi:hypothetical protein
MSFTHPYPAHGETGPAEIRGAAAATLVLVLLFIAFAFASRRDPTKLAAGIPCAMLSEDDATTVLGTPMRLMPTTGTICQYVSTGTSSRALFVIARHDPTFPRTVRDGVTLHGVGDEGLRTSNGTYVRYGGRSFKIIVVPQSPEDRTTATEELRIAIMMRRPMIARNP